MSPSLMTILQAAERLSTRDAMFCRIWYRRTGMTPAQVRHYGARRCWPDACQLVRMNGVEPYVAPDPAFIPY